MGPGGQGDLELDRERSALMLLRLLPGVGDRSLIRFLRKVGSAHRGIELPSRDFTNALGREADGARGDASLRKQAQQLMIRCSELGIEVVTLVDPGYPRRLLALADPPPVLFLRGDPSFLSRRCVAMVGSRRSTGVGRRTAERIAQELSEVGVTVASGLALGIDGAAHRGALSGSGGTIAVLGCGPDRVYPAGNRELFREIIRRGLLVSEFPPGDRPRAHHFPRRNRIIAGLSSGVIVVEAARKSGAIITVDHALDLGLEVFAVPGSVESVQAQGTNSLIRDGAHLLTSGSEVLEVLRWEEERASSDEPLSSFPIHTGTQPSLGPEPAGASDVRRVEAVFGLGPLALDQLVPRSGLPVERVLAALTRLELSGLVGRCGGGWSHSRAGR